MRARNPRHLYVAAHAELASLIVLLANLFTVHLRPVSSLMGPTHGCAYLFIVVATWRMKEAATIARVLAFIPGIGGLLALRQLDPTITTAATTNTATAAAEQEEAVIS
jgi:hypothetical protein